MSSARITTADIVARTTYQTTPDLAVEFVPDGWLLELVGASANAVVMASFDGIEDHMVLRVGKASASKGRAAKAQKIWLRTVSGVGSVIVDIETGTVV